MNEIIETMQGLKMFEPYKPASEAEIAEAEQELGLEFAQDYRAYLAAFGAMDAEGTEMTGIINDERLNVVSATKEAWKYHEDVPKSFYLIEDAGIDGILIWQDNSGNIYQSAPDSSPQKVAESLSAYLKARCNDEGNEDDDDEDEDDEDSASGWDAIDEAFKKLYPGQDNPLHFAPIIKAQFGGNDPLDGISIFDGGEFWHFVTYGFTELYEKESENPDYSGFGFELTLKLKKTPAVDENELKSVCGTLQGLARYVFSKGACFEPYEYIYSGQTEGMDVGRASKITGFITTLDEAGIISTPNGEVQFVQLVGATDSELRAVHEKKINTKMLLEIIETTLTDYERDEMISLMSEEELHENYEVIDEDDEDDDEDGAFATSGERRFEGDEIIQTLTAENFEQGTKKSVAAVKAAFVEAGYNVSLSVSDMGTEIESWSLTCLSLAACDSFSASFGYSEDWVELLTEGMIPTVKLYPHHSLKKDGCWYYHGQKEAVELFESLGTYNPVMLYEAEERTVDPSVAAVENALNAAGYTVTVSPHPDGTQLTCMIPGTTAILIAGNGKADWVDMMSGSLTASAESLNYELKRSGGWFYYGSPEAVELIEKNI